MYNTFLMLKILRHKGLAKKIFWLIIGVMVIAFVLWGAGASRQSSKTTDYCGEIFGKKIPSQEFFQLYSFNLNKLRLSVGEKYQELLPYLNLKEQTWTQLILLAHAKRLTLKASDQEVIQSISEMPLFLKNGKFDQGIYHNVVRYFFNSKPRDFEEQTRNELTLKKLFDELTRTVTINDEEVLATYKHEHEAISINYIKVEGKEFLDSAQISDDELKDYYQKNVEKFKRQPSVKIEYVGIPYPPEAQEAERLQIFEQMKTLHPKVKGAHELKEIAREPLIYQQTGFFTMDESPEEIKSYEFYRYAFSLAEKETSPLIQASDGVYALRVIQKKPSYTPDLNEVKEKVSEELKAIKAKEFAKKKIEEYKRKIDELLKGQSAAKLKTIAPLLPKELKTSAEFKRGGPIPDIGLEKNIIDTAFSLKPDQISGILETNSAYYIIAQEKFTGIDEEKYKQEKETYRKDLLERKKQSAFSGPAQAIIERANLKDYTASQPSK